MFLYNDIIAIFYVLAMKKTTGRQHYKPKLKFFQRLGFLEMYSRSTCMAEGF